MLKSNEVLPRVCGARIFNGSGSIAHSDKNNRFGPRDFGIGLLSELMGWKTNGVLRTRKLGDHCPTHPQVGMNEQMVIGSPWQLLDKT